MPFKDMSAEELEKQYKELLNHITSGVAIYEPYKDGQDFLFVDFNKTAEEIEGKTRESVLGKKVTEVFPGVVKMGLFSVMQRVYETGKEEHHPITLYKDRKLMGWRENFVYRLPNNNVVAIYSDETDQKINEQDLKECQAKNELLLKGVSDGIWDWNFITNEVIYSENWKKMLGFSDDEIKYDKSEGESRLHPDDKERCVSYARDYIKSGGSDIFEMELKMKHKKGHYISILSRAMLLKNDSGVPVRLIGFNKDLSEQEEIKRLKKEIEELKKK